MKKKYHIIAIFAAALLCSVSCNSTVSDKPSTSESTSGTGTEITAAPTDTVASSEIAEWTTKNTEAVSESVAETNAPSYGNTVDEAVGKASAELKDKGWQDIEV